MDRLRQGIFSSLGDRVSDARTCDLFAGTGSYGLEALSRGARSCHFIELNRNACTMIKDNLRIVAKSMGTPQLDAKVTQGDACKALGLQADRYDIVFVDPPYDLIQQSMEPLFKAIDPVLEKDGFIVFEMPGRLDTAPSGWVLKRRIGKGKNQPTACFYERESQ